MIKITFSDNFVKAQINYTKNRMLGSLNQILAKQAKKKKTKKCQDCLQHIKDEYTECSQEK
jgi:hypothetical protein